MFLSFFQINKTRINHVNTYPYEIVPYATEPEAAGENFDDADSSGELVERMRGSEGHSPQGAEARTPQTHPEAGSACCTPLRTAGTVFGDHYLEKAFNMTTNN